MFCQCLEVNFQNNPTIFIRKNVIHPACENCLVLKQQQSEPTLHVT